jgi:formate/nitrite transporter FocA (FNT family)
VTTSDPTAAAPASRVNDDALAAGREEKVEEALDRIVAEGGPRLHRQWPDLLATGTVAGMEVAIGVLALLAVEHATDSPLLGGVAFSFGFIALLLGHSELFTEGFLVPVTVVAAGRASLRDLIRLWLGTLIANLAGGWALTWVIMQAFPQLGGQAVKAAAFFIDSGIGLRSFCLALLAGSAITLMTRMQLGTDDVTAKVVAAIGGGFVLAGLQLAHSVLESLLIFTALHAGAPFGYADWAGWFGWTVLGNVVGGVGLVTVLRLIRSRELIAERRAEVAG